MPPCGIAAGIALIFACMVGYAKMTGQWNTNLPKQVYFQLVPNAADQEHPMPADR
jgi:hypothetical protein